MKASLAILLGLVLGQEILSSSGIWPVWSSSNGATGTTLALNSVDHDLTTAAYMDLTTSTAPYEDYWMADINQTPAPQTMSIFVALGDELSVDGLYYELLTKDSTGNPATHCADFFNSGWYYCDDGRPRPDTTQF
jgi:hypothetical protein